MDQLKPIEDKLGDLYKNAPKMSGSARKSLAGAMPWIALVFGILQLWSTYTLWHAGHIVNRFVDYANDLSAVYGGTTIKAQHLGVTFYLALIVLAVSAVTLLLAYPGLNARKKSGWNWLFLGSLINLVYGVVSVFVASGYGGGVGRLISALIGSAISFYLLYQIRDQYMGGEKVTPASPTPPAPKV